MPESIEIEVVLPAPLCPNRAKICPWNMLTVRLSTAFTSSYPLPNRFSNPTISMDLP